VTRLLVATTNLGKLVELTPLLAGLGLAPCGLDALPGQPPAPEEEQSLAANAASKALYWAARCEWPVLADDSGLEVSALHGAPGIHSARFAGPGADDEANNALLLRRLAGVTDRRAQFVCCLAMARGREVTLQVSGECPGRILEAPCGKGGFGYDPLFVPDDPRAAGRSFAQLGRPEKAELSHRAQALAALQQALAAEAGR